MSRSASRVYSDSVRVGLEIEVAHHGLLARPDDAGQLGQLDGALRRHPDSQVDEAPGRVAIGGIERGQQPGHMRVRREQPHHGHRVDGPASGAGLAVGEQLRALRDGGEWLGHGRQSHKSNDARMRFHAEAQNRQTGFAPSCASTDAVAVALLESADADFRKSTKTQNTK
jgi:hypothetical protein